MPPTEFNQQEFDLAYPPGVEFNYWTVARNRILWRALARQGWLTGEWVEVGCGRGIVLQFLRQRGLEVRGVELAPVQALPQVAGHVLTGVDVCDLPAVERARPQGVLLLDVIEHLPDPVAFLRRLRESLPGVQRWLVTVPAHPELWSNYDEFYGHQRRYTAAVLEEQLTAAGLRPLVTRHFFHALYPAARLLLGSGRQRAVKITAPPAWQRPLHQALGLGFALESSLLPATWPGTSLMCLAETAAGQSQ